MVGVGVVQRAFLITGGGWGEVGLGGRSRFDKIIPNTRETATNTPPSHIIYQSTLTHIATNPSIERLGEGNTKTKPANIPDHLPRSKTLLPTPP